MGNVHIVWKSYANAAHQILHRIWNGSTFSSINPVSTTSSPADPRPRIAVGNDNNVHVAWQELDTVNNNYQIIYSKWNSSSWSPEFVISSTAQSSRLGVPSVAVLKSSIDDVLVGWIDKSTSPLKLAFRKYNAASSSWQIARTNDIQQTSADFPVAAMDKWDNVHVAWGEKNSATNKHEIFYDAIPLAINQIGSSGGTLTTFNGDTLSVPAGALSQDTLISAQVAPLSQAAPNGYNTPNRQYIFEPSGLTYAIPITVVFHYTDAEFSGADEKNIGVYVWDSQSQSWVFNAGVLNKGANTVTVNLDHFSIYSFFSLPDDIIWQNPLNDVADNEFKLGRTIPIKFGFSTPIQDPAQIKLEIYNGDANKIAQFAVGSTDEDLRYDSASQTYHANLKSQGLTSSNYQINVMDQGNFKGSFNFVLR